MLLTQRIIEVCLISKDGVTPFAVIVEQGEYCAWSIASGRNHTTSQQWNGHVLAAKERRPEEWWVLDAWKEWLDEISQETPGSRICSLMKLERETPGIVIRQPREVHTRLPVGAIASRWRRNRLFERTEIIVAEIAHKLARGGTAHWNSSISINDCESLKGDWIIEQKPRPESDMNFDDKISEIGDSNMCGIAIINRVGCEHIESVKDQWSAAKNILKEKCPCNVVIVKNDSHAEVSDLGCIIGERFPSPVSLAIAVVRSQWYAGCY